MTRYQVLIGSPAHPHEYQPGDYTLTVTAGSELDAVYQAAVGLAGTRTAMQLRRLVVKAVQEELPPPPGSGLPDGERDLTGWMGELRDQVNGRRNP